MQRPRGSQSFDILQELKDAKWGQREWSGERTQPPEVGGWGQGWREALWD